MVISKYMLDFDLGFAVLSLCCFQWFNTSKSKRTSRSSLCSGLWSGQKNNVLMGMSKSIWSWFLEAETLWMRVRWRKPDGKVVSWFWERFTCRKLKQRTQGGDSFLKTKRGSALRSYSFQTNAFFNLHFTLCQEKPVFETFRFSGERDYMRKHPSCLGARGGVHPG